MKFTTVSSATAAALVVGLLSSSTHACDHEAVKRATLANQDPAHRAEVHRRHFLHNAHMNHHHGKRQSSGSRKYPPQGVTPPKSMTPQEWLDALAAAEKAGKIPNIPQTKLHASTGAITYPSGTDINSVCSWTQTNCFGANDISKAPDGVWALNFDDGPNTPSPTLYKFLQQQNKAATFFLIGSNIAGNPDVIKQAAQMGVAHFNVHTWSHTVQTTLSNEDIVAELGWTMQIIYDLTGKIPRYWRPPQGDADKRVRAVAEEVFGLYAVMWDEECNDWCITESGGIAPGCDTAPGNSIASVQKAIDQATQKSKSPGVILLEHDLTTYSIKAFEEHSWTGIQKNGWNAMSVGDFPGNTWYANAANATSPTTGQTSMLKSARVAVSGSGSGSGASGSSGNPGSSSSSSTTYGRPASSTSVRVGATAGPSGAASARVSSSLLGAASGSVAALLAVAVGAAALI
ncbi:hypothetical protein OC846_005569 [Tilletia horrida]|uniref:chitin deacetylase n=1 Tax=Tilletia horrida TaxID=155126 RepID=A0AAN6JRK9_9BASI|nr:hypothetical protein OC846_005569 [Tilletia horrida]